MSTFLSIQLQINNQYLFVYLFIFFPIDIDCHIFKGASKGLLWDSELKDDYIECVGLLNVPPNSSMECIMIEIFKKFDIDNAVWQLSKNTKYYQITFFVETNTHHELVLTTLNEWGIGQRNGSCMSMIPCAIYNQSAKTTTNTIGTSTEYVSFVFYRN